MKKEHFPVRLVLPGKVEATGKYVCSICGYVYDPSEHDGVAFTDLPDDGAARDADRGRKNSIKLKMLR